MVRYILKIQIQKITKNIANCSDTNLCVRPAHPSKHVVTNFPNPLEKHRIVREASLFMGWGRQIRNFLHKCHESSCLGIHIVPLYHLLGYTALKQEVNCFISGFTLFYIQTGFTFNCQKPLMLVSRNSQCNLMQSN